MNLPGMNSQTGGKSSRSPWVTLAILSCVGLILIVARIMQGVGASMFAISFSIIRDKFAPEKLAVAQGIFSSMFSAGAVMQSIIFPTALLRD